MIKYKKRMILIILCGVFIIYLSYSLFDKRAENAYIDKIKIILDINHNKEINYKIKDENLILLSDYDYFSNNEVGYNEGKSTILYINDDGDFIEKNIQTGLSYKLDYLDNIEDLLDIKTSSKSEKNAITCIQYGPGADEISFIFDNNIYVYNISKNEVMKKTNCSTNMYYFIWKNQSELYTLHRYNDHGTSGVFLWREGKKEVLIVDAVVYFNFSDEKDFLYCIRENWIDKDIIIEIQREIIEVNLSNGNTRKLVKTGTDRHNILKCIDNQYLIYVIGNYQKKSYKIYCYDLINNEKQYLYKTKERIIGILKN